MQEFDNICHAIANSVVIFTVTASLGLNLLMFIIDYEGSAKL